MRFGSDSPEVAEAVQAARRKARAVQSWLDQMLDVAPPEPKPKDDDDAESRRNQILP